MSQDYRELQPSDTLGDSRGYLNETHEAILTCHAGASAPTTPAAYMLWADTTTGLLKQRNAANDAWVTVGTLGAAGLGLLSTAGGTMTGPIAMGGQQITDVGLGTGTAVARQQEVDLKAPIAAPTFTGDAKVSQDPAGNDSIPRRIWTEGRYLKLAGGTVTGPVGSSGYTAGSTEFVPLASLRALVTFDVSTGHRHDGSDARKVQAASLTTGSETDGTIPTANGSGGISFVKGAKAMVFGRVSSAGAKTLEGGAGYSITKTGTGAYTITFAGGVFSVAPACLVFVEGSVRASVDVTISSATTVLVQIGYLLANTGTGQINQVAADGAFSFIALE